MPHPASPCYNTPASSSRSSPLPPSPPPGRPPTHRPGSTPSPRVCPVRIGYQFDGIANHQYLSGGIGWFSDGSGIDFSYRHELGGQEGRLISLTLKLQL